MNEIEKCINSAKAPICIVWSRDYVGYPGVESSIISSEDKAQECSRMKRYIQCEFPAYWKDMKFHFVGLNGKTSEAKTQAMAIMETLEEVDEEAWQGLLSQHTSDYFCVKGKDLF